MCTAVSTVDTRETTFLTCTTEHEAQRTGHVRAFSCGRACGFIYVHNCEGDGDGNEQNGLPSSAPLSEWTTRSACGHSPWQEACVSKENCIIGTPDTEQSTRTQWQ